MSWRNSFAALALAFALTGCGAVAQIAGGDFCAVYRETMTNKQKFTAGEIAAMRPVTKRDQAAMKLHYRERCR